MSRFYRSLEVTGLELEYPIVGPDLGISRLVPDLLAHLAGPEASDARLGEAGLSNEFVDHLLELKNEVPLPSLDLVEHQLSQGVRDLFALLRREFGAGLLPTGMHPFLRPEETGRWAGEGCEIYEAYARLFPVEAHGWTNVQSCHVNLPFGTEEECCLLLNATALLLPYLPALAASSPIVEGHVAPAVDQRLRELWGLQARIPESCGQVIPEYLTSLDGYRQQILDPMYRSLDRFPHAAVLRHEFFNSRGAILRFDRLALEVRVLDTQECVRLDVAMAALVRAGVRVLMEDLRTRSLELPPHAALVSDYRATVEAGRDALVAAPHLPGAGRAGRALEVLLDRALGAATVDELPYLELAGTRLEEGNLSERIRRRLGLSPGTPVPRGPLLDLYRELQVCLEHNRSFSS